MYYFFLFVTDQYLYLIIGNIRMTLLRRSLDAGQNKVTIIIIIIYLFVQIAVLHKTSVGRILDGKKRSCRHPHLLTSNRLFVGFLHAIINTSECRLPL